MESISLYLEGFIPFVICMVGAFIALLLFKFLYALVTPHDEWKLIKEENIAAAIGFGGAIVGYSIALSSAIKSSASLVDFMLWAFIALITQIIAFAILRFLFMPALVKRIQDNSISTGIILASFSISFGLLNAASMSY